MKTKILSITVIFLFAIAFGIAKDDFTVFATKGDLTVQKNGKGKWSKLATGTKLSTSDNVKVGEKAYLSLIHNSGKTVELKQSGVFSLSKLSEAVKKNQSSITAKLAKYILNEIQSSDDLTQKGDHHNNMGVTGAVERKIGSDEIQLASPSKTTVKNDALVCAWTPVNGEKSYEFCLTDRFDNKILTKKIDGNQITVNTVELKLEKDQFYFWNVASASNADIKSEKATFIVLSPEKVKMIESNVKQLKSEMEGETAVNQFVLGNYYDQNNLVEEANLCFKRAIELAPDVPEYNKIYTLFKQKNNIKN